MSRMATFAEGGRIHTVIVQDEIERLQRSWQGFQSTTLAETAISLDRLLSNEVLSELDLFDRRQLEQVVAECLRCRSLSEAGRTLFSASRKQRTSVNDADRLRKYLARFGLAWDQIQQAQHF